MPHIKSKKKRVITNEKSRQRNVNRRSEIKTLTKRVHEVLAAEGKEAAMPAFRAAESRIARAVNVGLLKKNNASRKISRLSHAIVSFVPKEATKKKAATKKKK